MVFRPWLPIIATMGAAVWTMLLVVLGPLAGWGCGRVRPRMVGLVLLSGCLVLALWPVVNDWSSDSVGWPWLIALLLLHLLLVLVPYGVARSTRFAKRRTRVVQSGR